MVVRSKSEHQLGFEHCDLEGTVPLTNFRYLLYVGGADTNQRAVISKIESGQLGEPRLPRQHLVSIFHSYFERRFQTCTRTSIFSEVFSLRKLYTEYDKLGMDLTADNVGVCYEAYSRNLWDQVLKGVCSMSAETAYSQDADIRYIIQGALEMPEGLLRTAFSYSELRRRGLAGRMKVDKSDLNDSFEFGADVLNVIDAFSLEACLGELPIKIRHSDGSIHEYWGNLRAPDLLLQEGERSPEDIRKYYLAREKLRLSGDVKTRASVLNIRVHAEFNLFVAQTGMNVSPAYNLPMEDYRCTTFQGGYRVTAFKPRRGSEVEFMIFSEYRTHFERYLRFLKEAYPDGCEYLFPFLVKGEKRAMKYRQSIFASLLKDGGRKSITLQSLREKRVNWMLRETHDPEMVADAAQHTVGTMVRNYSKPNHHIAAYEFSSLFAKRKAARAAVLEGECVPSNPKPRDGSAVTPDCINPTGCLFCEHYEGVQSFDYIWSIATFRYLKYSEYQLIPLSKNIDGSPQQSTTERLDQIMDDFSSHSPECHAWREEADLRISERDFHDNYRALIEVRFNG